MLAKTAFLVAATLPVGILATNSASDAAGFMEKRPAGPSALTKTLISSLLRVNTTAAVGTVEQMEATRAVLHNLRLGGSALEDQLKKEIQTVSGGINMRN